MVRFKICIIPMVSALLIVVLLTLLTGEDGVIGRITILPAGAWKPIRCLVISPRKFILNGHRQSAPVKIPATIKKSCMQVAIYGGIIIGIFALVATTAFYLIDGSKDSFGQAMVHSIPFMITTLLIYAFAGNYWNWNSKKLAAVNPRLGKFSSRWTTLSASSSLHGTL